MNVNNIFFHKFINIRRTWSFESEIVSAITKLFFNLFIILNFLATGFLLDIIIKQDINFTLTSILLGTGLAEIIIKITIEKKYISNLTPYITLPIKLWRLKIHDFICNLFKIGNFVTFSVFAVYFVKQIFIADFPILDAFLYIIIIFGFELFTESLFNWFKSLSSFKSILCSIIYIAFYLGCAVFILNYFSEVESLFFQYKNPLILGLLIVLLWALTWIFHSLQFKNECRNTFENSTSQKVRVLKLYNLSIYSQLILKNIFRGKIIKSFIIPFFLGIFFIIQNYDAFHSHVFVKMAILSYGLFSLFQMFLLASQPIFSYLSCYADGLTCVNHNYYNKILRNHYKINLIYSSIVAIIFAAITQRFFLSATMFMLNISISYFLIVIQNFYGGVSRVDIFNPSTNKTFNTIVVLYFVFAMLLTLLCVIFEKNIYFNISIIVICFVCFIKRDKFFNFLCNKLKQNRYKNLAIYRGEVN
ncbi:MAG: hypothetical protein MJ211_05080 [Bacteroidales bacterium]|nr:hypothetical protein [Bacteroidales bacterium]